jgi:hypothetical protein
MNVKEFREWLKQFPEETIVEVGIQATPDLYQSYGALVFNEFQGDEDEDYQYIDLTNNLRVKDPANRTRTLYLGTEE